MTIEVRGGLVVVTMTESGASLSLAPFQALQLGDAMIQAAREAISAVVERKR